MRNRLIDLGIGALALAFAFPAYAASGHLTQSTVRAPKPMVRGAVRLVPGAAQTHAAVAPVRLPTVRLDGVLLAVLGDSVILERQIDATTLRAWRRAGTFPQGVRSLSAITTVAVIEDRIYERLYFDGGTMDIPEDMKQVLHRSVRVEVRPGASGRNYLVRLKP